MNDIMKWQVLNSEYISNHKYFTARKDKCLRHDGVVIDAYYVVELPVTATALAITADNKVILARQYRHPIGEVLLETPGGFIDAGEDFAIGIQRELMEETGYEFPEIEHLGRVAANPGVLSNYTELFIAKGGVKVSGQHLDDHEEIDVVLVTLEELIDMLMKNEIKQSLHATCIFYALMKMGKLQLVK